MSIRFDTVYRFLGRRRSGVGVDAGRSASIEIDRRRNPAGKLTADSL